MKKKAENEKKSQYSERLRLSKKHLDFLKKNKTTKTIAGYAAEIFERHILSLKLHKLDHKELKDRGE